MVKGGPERRMGLDEGGTKGGSHLLHELSQREVGLE